MYLTNAAVSVAAAARKRPASGMASDRQYQRHRRRSEFSKRQDRVCRQPGKQRTSRSVWKYERASDVARPNRPHANFAKKNGCFESPAAQMRPAKRSCQRANQISHQPAIAIAIRAQRVSGLIQEWCSITAVPSSSGCGQRRGRKYPLQSVLIER